MEKFDRSCVTNLGRNAIAKLNAGGSSLVLTKVQMGRGIVDPSTDIQTFTELVDGVQYNDINSANTLVPYQTTIAFTIKGSDVEKTFKWSELGIFARLNDGEEFLFAYAYSSNPDTLVEGSKVVDQYVFGIRFENSEKVTVELHVDQTVSLHAATHLDNDVDPIPTVSSERTGLVPVGPDDSRLVLVGHKIPRWDSVPLADRTTPGGIPPLNGRPTTYLAGSGRWTRITPFFHYDTTIYVDPDIGDHWPVFSTLEKALEFLIDVNISAGATITIELADGTHTIDNGIAFDHPQAQQVRIVGASQRQRTKFTHLKENGYDLILRAESVKDLSVGMSVIIQGGGGEWNVHPGGHTIRHIENDYVTVSRSLWGVGEWWNEYNLGASHIYYYKTEVDCPNGGLFFPNGIDRLSHMSMHGHSDYLPFRCDHAISTTGRSSFSDLIVNNFCRGIVSRYAPLRSSFVCVYDCADGIIADFGSIYENPGSVYCNGNRNVGLWFNRSGGQSGQMGYHHGKITYLKGNSIGLLSSSSAMVELSSAAIQFNRVGIFAVSRGTIFLGSPSIGDEPSSPVWSNANSQIDLLAWDGGYIKGTSYGGYLGSCNPPSRQSGNEMSFIVIDNN